MPRGKNLSKERKIDILNYQINGKTPRECHNALFLGSEAECTYKHIQKIFGMYEKEPPYGDNATSLYITGANKRGKNPTEFWWYDKLINELVIKNPTQSSEIIRQLLTCNLGPGIQIPCLTMVKDSIRRTKLNRTRLSYLPSAQNPILVWEHMERMKYFDAEMIINWDETSCSSEKFLPIYGRGNSEIIINEWRIGDKLYSAIAAMTTMGFLPCTRIYDRACSSDTIENFLLGLQPFIEPSSLALFDNATVNTCDASLDTVNRIFGTRWVRNAPYSPKLAPIERGFSLVWNLVRQRWAEALINPLPVLLESFFHYTVGQPGGETCSSFFNVYRRNRECFLTKCNTNTNT